MSRFLGETTSLVAMREDTMTKKVAVVRNAKTGSVTVRVPKSASTGKFVVESKPDRTIQVRASANKAS